jgi:hypothetical protein
MPNPTQTENKGRNSALQKGDKFSPATEYEIKNQYGDAVLRRTIGALSHQGSRANTALSALLSTDITCGKIIPHLKQTGTPLRTSIR